MDELAVPFSKHVVEHVSQANRQGTSKSSRFLEACRKFSRGELQHEGLVKRTVALGFENVIDAFHVVNKEALDLRFFVDERKTRGGISITDELFRLKESAQFPNLPMETEARWRLVETAWDLRLHPSLLTVSHDEDSALLFVTAPNRRRIDVTSARDALDGYQKGKCFYCFQDISIEPFSSNLADVDHFFPHRLLVRSDEVESNLNGVWNLVLACRQCNRGEDGKSARVPKLRYLERLHVRNTYLIESHHPLRETLIKQTGASELVRQRFLQQQYNLAKSLLIHEWEPREELAAAF